MSSGRVALAIGAALLAAGIWIAIQQSDQPASDGHESTSEMNGSAKSNRAPVSLDPERRIRIAKGIRQAELDHIHALDRNIKRFDVASVDLLELYESLYPERHAAYELYLGEEGLEGHVLHERRQKLDLLKDTSLLLQLEDILATPDHDLLFDDRAKGAMESYLPTLTVKLNKQFAVLELPPLRPVRDLDGLRAVLRERRDDIWSLYDSVSEGMPEVVRNDTHYVAHNQLIAVAMRQYVETRLKPIKDLEDELRQGLSKP